MFQNISGKRLFRNNIFRLSMFFIFLFIILAGITTIISYYTIKRNIKISVSKELDIATNRYFGIYNKKQLGPYPDDYIFVIEENGKKVLGNIEKIPSDKENSIIIISIAGPDKNKMIEVMGKVSSFGTTRIFLGKNDYLERERQYNILEILISSSITFSVFSIIGGLLLSFRAVRRIDRINMATQAILDGDISFRIPLLGRNDDIETLSAGINNMLDLLNDMMQDVRRATDNIAHDLRTPLTRLQGRVVSINKTIDELNLLENNCIDKKEKDYIREIQKNVEFATKEIRYLLDIFSALLRIADVESKSTTSHFRKINIANTLYELIDFYEVLAEEKLQKIYLNFDLKEEILIYTDKELISQAIVNLITNAIKYTPEGGSIEIDLYKKGDFIIVKISDTGFGVPEDEIEKLGQRFYRQEKHRDIESGNGLGLALVKVITKRLKGDILFNNRPERTGLIAKLVLPIYPK